MTDTHWVLIFGGAVTLVGLVLSSLPFVVAVRLGSTNAQIPVTGLIILAIGASLLVAAITIDRRS